MDTKQPISIGAQVKVRYSTDEDLPREKWPQETGVVKEDFGDQASSEIDRTWAPAHRYAVALDDGRLVFVDPEDIEST